MTYAPQSLKAWRAYMQGKTGLPARSLGHVGSQGHHAAGTSYHIGWDSLFSWAYSRQHPRDTKLKTDAASATDTGYGTSQFTHTDLVDLTKWAVSEARAGRRPDTRELIGPWDDGRAYRFDALNNWKAEQRANGDSHEFHLHESRFRDAENRNWIQYYQPFFEGANNMSILGLRQGDNNIRVGALQVMLRQAGQNLTIDNDYGPKTAAAVLATRKAVGSKATSGKSVGRYAYAQIHQAQNREDIRKALAKFRETLDLSDGQPVDLPEALTLMLGEITVPVEWDDADQD